MMKYFIFFLVIIASIGFAVRTVPVYAAASPPAEAVLGTTETQMLSKTLLAVQSLLKAVDAEMKTAPPDASRAAVMSATLSEIGKGLSRIDAMIDTKALAYAAKGSIPASPSVVAQGEIAPALESAPFVLANPDDSPSLVENSLGSPQTESVTANAVAATSAQSFDMPWWASFLVVVFVVGLFIWWRNRKGKGEEAEEAPAPAVSASKTSIIQEDSVKIFPPLREKDARGTSFDY